MSDSSAAEAKPAKKKKPIVLIAAAALLLAGGSAGAAWYFAGHGKPHEAKVEEKKPSRPLFTTLEPFTVNLQDARGDRFAQIGITLQFEDPSVEVTVKDRLPAVRNEILMLISSKQVEELLSVEGKRELAQQIRWRTARAMGVEVADASAASAKADGHGEGKKGADRKMDNPIQDVLFSQFIVQ